MAPPLFDGEEFRRRIMELSDADLKEMGRSFCAAGSRGLDSVMREDNKAKYWLCKREWSRRHPRTRSPRSRYTKSTMQSPGHQVDR